MAQARGSATGGRQVKATAARRVRSLRMLGAGGVAAGVLLAAVQGCAAHIPAPRGSSRTGPAAAGPSATERDPAVRAPAQGPLIAGTLRPASPSPSSSPAQDPLGTAAASYIASRSGTVVAAVSDVSTGRTWTLGPPHPQAEASIVKLDILETLYARGGGPAGLSTGDQALAQQMMEDSDNSAATSLWNDVGGPATIQSFNAAAGLTHTAPSSCVTCPGFAWPGWGLSTTTPADQIALLRQIVKPSTLLTDEQRRAALQFMENVDPSQRWGITGGVPSRVTVAVKDGWLPLNSASTDWQINSIGWVSGSGRDYLMAVLTTGNPTQQYGIDTINGLSAIVWGRMG
jgi:Beta-lactamase enzyme family